MKRFGKNRKLPGKVAAVSESEFLPKITKGIKRIDITPASLRKESGGKVRVGLKELQIQPAMFKRIWTGKESKIAAIARNQKSKLEVRKETAKKLHEFFEEIKKDIESGEEGTSFAFRDKEVIDVKFADDILSRVQSSSKEFRTAVANLRHRLKELAVMENKEVYLRIQGNTMTAFNKNKRGKWEIRTFVETPDIDVEITRGKKVEYKDTFYEGMYG